jgi:hypothetical protein
MIREKLPRLRGDLARIGDLLAEVRDVLAREGRPELYGEWLRTEFGIDAGRASRLIAAADEPDPAALTGQYQYGSAPPDLLPEMRPGFRYEAWDDEGRMVRIIPAGDEFYSGCHYDGNAGSGGEPYVEYPRSHPLPLDWLPRWLHVHEFTPSDGWQELPHDGQPPWWTTATERPEWRGMGGWGRRMKTQVSGLAVKAETPKDGAA